MNIDIQAARNYYYQREARLQIQREHERQHWLQRVREVVPHCALPYPDIERVYLFGSLAQQGQFGARSDIDLALVCNNVQIESHFWRKLEQTLQRDVDMRPLSEAILDAVQAYGELIYERKVFAPLEKHSS
jgi:predicted nucleotidyltransferase